MTVALTISILEYGETVTFEYLENDGLLLGISNVVNNSVTGPDFAADPDFDEAEYATWPAALHDLEEYVANLRNAYSDSTLVLSELYDEDNGRYAHSYRYDDGSALTYLMQVVRIREGREERIRLVCLTERDRV